MSTELNGNSTTTTNGINGTTPTTTAASSSYPAALLRTYLTSLLPPILGARPDELESLFSTDEYGDSSWEEAALPFLASNLGALAGGYEDTTTTSSSRAALGNVLYVTRRRVVSALSKDQDGAPVPEEPVVDGGDETYTLDLATNLAGATSGNTQVLALIKRTPVLDPNIPLHQQIHFLNVNGGAVYESVHTVITNGVKPWFEAFVGTKKSVSGGGGASGEDGKMGLFSLDVFFSVSYASFHLPRYPIHKTQIRRT